jgi:citrate synthase
MREGIEVAGFAHPLYPQGDPRGRCLLDMLEPSELASNLLREASDLLGVLPNIDFALVAVARSLGLPNGSALGLFALGRTVGWIAHALEQVAGGQLIRPRARYTGENPTFS